MSDTNRHDVIIALATDEYPRNSEGSVVRLDTGRLLAAWTAFERGTGDDTTAHIKARISGDDGTTWGEPFVLLENVAAQNTMSVSLHREQSGGLLMAVLEKYGPGDCRLVVRRAVKEVGAWSSPVTVTRGVNYNVMNNDRLAEDRAGRIYAPVSFTREPVWSGGDHFLVQVWYSDDGGDSWFESRSILDAPKRGAMEPGIVETSDGGLLMIIRTQIGEILTSRSDDAGVTWSEPEPLGMPSPEAPATIGKLPDGRLALVYIPGYDSEADHGGKRTPLRVATSSDDGRTWHDVGDLESDTTKTYGYVSWLAEQYSVYVTYYVCDEQGRYSLKFSRLDMSWFS